MRVMNEFLIDGLWILEIESGSCLFEENYKKWSIQDTQLISSFLTAIRSFIKEAFSEDIEFIQFKTRKIIFEVSGKILFIIAVSNSNFSEDILKDIIKNLVIKFNQSFQSILKKKNIISEFRTFQSFSKDLGQIIGRKPVNIRLLTESKIDRLYRKKHERRLRRMKEMKRFL